MPDNDGAAPQQSFAERKRAQLSEERVVREAPTEDESQPISEPRSRIPEELESDQDLNQPNYGEAPEVEASGEEGYAEDIDEDLDDEIPESEFEDDGPEQPAENWEERYKDVQRKLSEVTENRRAVEQEHADIMSANLTLKHGLEDHLSEAKRFVEAYRGGFDQQIAQLESAFSSGMIPPDELPQARQQYQQLMLQRNSLIEQVDEIGKREAEVRRVEQERRAEIARVRLNRTIPNWGKEKYEELGQYAVSRGYSAEEFSESTDYRFLELLHDSMQLRQAGDKVKSVKRQRKAGGPKRNAKQQPRSADGRFRQAQQAFHDNPNQRGRFAEMKLAQMRKERGR